MLNAEASAAQFRLRVSHLITIPYCKGVPVIATAYSSCIELLQGRGELIAVKEFVTVGRHNIDYAIPDTDNLLDKLSEVAFHAR
jgi:hypothetical protein